MTFFDSLMRGVGQGATYGLSDEAIGGISALYAKLMAPELFQGQSFANLYEMSRDDERNKNYTAQQENPYTYGAAELASGLAAPAARLGSGFSSAVKAGLGYGGIAGYGYSNEQSLLKQAQDAATGSLIGGALGAGVYGATKAAQNPKVQKAVKDYIADESGALTIGGRKDLPINTTQEEFEQMLSGDVNRPFIQDWLRNRGVSKKKGFSNEEITSIADDAMKYRREVVLKDVIDKQKILLEREAIKRYERTAYLNSPEYQQKKIDHGLKELESINSAKDRLKWSATSIKEVERYNELYGEDAFSDRFYSNDAAKKATLESIQREAKKRGIEIVHSSGKASAKNASSLYLKHPDFGEVRVSDHNLPETPERAYKRENWGKRWNGEYIIGNDWKTLTIDQIFEKIKKAGIGED